MQTDNALTAWAGLICENDQKFLSCFLKGKEFKDLKVSWETLGCYMPTGDMDKSIQNLTAGFLKRTLDKIVPGTKELYDKGCKFVHPSAPLIKASWFGETVNSFVYKNWHDVKPVDYEEPEIVTDYLTACKILLGVMLLWLAFKKANVDIALSGKYDATAIVSEKDKAKVCQALKPLFHKGKDGTKK